MTHDDRSLERAARSWIEAGPTRAPDRAVEGALLQIETTAQERDLPVPWRLPTVTTPYRLVVAALIAVFVIGGGALLLNNGLFPTVGSSPTPHGSTATSPSPGASPDAYSTRQGWILLEHFGANAPDGSGAATGPNGRSLWLIRADGSGLHELAPEVPPDGKIAPAWSPDGTHIAFQTVDPLVRIFETGPDGGKVHPVSQCSGEAASCVESSPAYSPDGNSLAFATSLDGLATNFIGIRDRCDASTNCVSGGQVFHQVAASLESTRVATAVGWVEGIDWSPDGKQLVYYLVGKDAQGKPTGTSELWVVGADRSSGTFDTGLHKIPLPVAAGDPSWSPDSSRILFSSQPIHDWNDVGVADAPDVYTVRPDGTDLQRLTHDAGSGSPSWTSDGKILFYHQRAMWLMDADGSNARPVYPGGPTLWGEQTGWSYYGYWQPTP